MTSGKHIQWRNLGGKKLKVLWQKEIAGNTVKILHSFSVSSLCLFFLFLFMHMIFPVVMFGCENMTMKKAECRRIDAFKLWGWGRPLRVAWTARRSNQWILKEVKPDYSLEGLMLKHQYSGHLRWRADSFEKDPDAGKDCGQEEKRVTKDEMVDHITDSMDMNLSRLQEIVEDRGAWSVAVHGVAESDLNEWLNNNPNVHIKQKNEMALLSLCCGGTLCPILFWVYDYYFISKCDRLSLRFSISGLGQSHLKTLLKYALLDSKPKVPNSVGLGKGT